MEVEVGSFESVKPSVDHSFNISINVDSVVKFLDKLEKGELTLSFDQKKAVLIACANLVRKKSKNRTHRQNKDEDKIVLQKIRAKRISEKPIITEEMGRLSLGDDDDQTSNTKSVEGEKRNCSRRCYVCKTRFYTIHHFYIDMCNECGDFNFKMRNLSVDLTGKVALVTGGRVKIGFECALKLLRCGAHVIVVTRFPKDAVKRFALEKDFQVWHNRLDIKGCDLRFTPKVKRLCEDILQQYSSLDIIINNACQTIQKPTAYYEHLLKDEDPQTKSDLFDSSRAMTSFEQQFFPPGLVDEFGQQLDLRPVNSWNLTLAEIPTCELYEVMLVSIDFSFSQSRSLLKFFGR